MFERIFSLNENEVSIPIFLFHKVVDHPEYPEDITTQDLYNVFTLLWKEGYIPINFSDIFKSDLSMEALGGKKPVCLTSDDSHPSMMYNSIEADIADLDCRQSFMEILIESLLPFNISPKATFFLSRVNNDRISLEPEGYFGGIVPFPELIQKMKRISPEIEYGYHLIRHNMMTKMGRNEIRKVFEEQIDDFKSMGVEEEVSKIFAYPYGELPAINIDTVLEEFGFYGAALAFDGTLDWRKKRYAVIKGGRLLAPKFYIPRIGISSFDEMKQELREFCLNCM